MAERKKDLKISLSELPRKDRPSISYMMKVPNFFTMSDNDHNEVNIDSPPFAFAFASWCFNFQSKGEGNKTDRLIKNFDIYLERLSSIVQSRNVFFSIMLLDADNEKHDDHYGSCVLTEFNNNDFLCSFRNSNLFYDRRETLTLIVHLISEELPNVIGICPFHKGMAEKAKDFRISLYELPKKKFSFVKYTMKVPNFFTLPEYSNIKGVIKSPSFEFCNASWQFYFSKVEDPEGRSKSFHLHLVRLNSGMRKHLICYTLLLMDGDNDHDDKSSADLFNEDGNDVCVWTFSKRKLPDQSAEILTLNLHLICIESPEENLVQELINKKLLEDYKKLFLNGKNHDLTLRVAKKKFRVHKDVLMARSPVFNSMLSHDMTEKNKDFIDITDCDPQAMEQFLFYVYCGKLDTLNIVEAIELYYIADKYSMALLKKQCSEAIKKSLSPPMFCKVIKLSVRHSDTDLLEYAAEYLKNHMHDVFITSEWMSFLTENVTVANELLVKASKKWKYTKS